MRKLHKLKINTWKDTVKWQKYYDKKGSGKGFSANQATCVFEISQPGSTMVTVTLHGVPSTLKITSNIFHTVGISALHYM